MGSAYASPIAANTGFRLQRRTALTRIKLYVATFAAFATFATLAGAGAAAVLLVPQSSAPGKTVMTPVVTTAQRTSH